MSRLLHALRILHLWPCTHPNAYAVGPKWNRILYCEDCVTHWYLA